MLSDPFVDLLKRLHPTQIDLLTEIVLAMLREVKEKFDASSDIASELFRISFRNRLLLHHATSEAKLTKKAFEYAFRAASIAAGRNASIISSQTNSGTDVVVDDVAFSLKTEADASIHTDRVTISKLMEARWIQQCSTLDDLAQAAVDRIPKHLQQYERILTLRAHNSHDNAIYYELVEIPRTLLLEVQRLTSSDFSPRTRQGGSTARVEVEGQHAFSLRLDGSDGKVTIGSLRLSSCQRHCSWTIPTSVPPTSNPEDPSP
jgi:hypothetical protein